MSCLCGVNSVGFHAIGQSPITKLDISRAGRQITWQWVVVHHLFEKRRKLNNWEYKVFTVLPYDIQQVFRVI